MSALITSTSRFDLEWRACVVARTDAGFDTLKAMKEGLRDYVSIIMPVSPLTVRISGQVYEISFIHAMHGGRQRIELTSVKLATAGARPAFVI